MENYERIEKLEEAESLINEAIDLIVESLSGTKHYDHANSYIIPHLKTWIGLGNPYDTSIGDYIEMLENE
jgi:hypothetical protein